MNNDSPAQIEKKLSQYDSMRARLQRQEPGREEQITDFIATIPSQELTCSPEEFMSIDSIGAKSRVNLNPLNPIFKERKQAEAARRRGAKNHGSLMIPTFGKKPFQVASDRAMDAGKLIRAGVIKTPTELIQLILMRFYLKFEINLDPQTLFETLEVNYLHLKVDLEFDKEDEKMNGILFGFEGFFPYARGTFEHGEDLDVSHYVRFTKVKSGKTLRAGSKKGLISYSKDFEFEDNGETLTKTLKRVEFRLESKASSRSYFDGAMNTFFRKGNISGAGAKFYGQIEARLQKALSGKAKSCQKTKVPDVREAIRKGKVVKFMKERLNLIYEERARRSKNFVTNNRGRLTTVYLKALTEEGINLLGFVRKITKGALSG